MPVIPKHIMEKYKGRTRVYQIARAEEYWAKKQKRKPVPQAGIKITVLSTPLTKRGKEAKCK